MSLFHLQLLSYAKHRNIEKTNGFDSSTESGYSVYVFGSDLSDYCIFDEVGPFRNLRILLWASFGALEIAVTFAAPLIMISVYHDFKRKMNDDKSRLRYYVWAMIVVMTLLIGPIYACNSLAISSGSYFVDVRVETYCLIVFLVALPILDFVWAVIAIAVFEFFEKAALNEKKAICLDCYYVNCLCRHTDYYFIESESENGTSTQYLNNNKLNEDQRNDHSDNDESEVRTRKHLNEGLNVYKRKLMIKLVLKNGCHLASIAFITLFAQLTLFNSVFISFAVIAAPVESGSLLFLYLSSLFALISVLATGLKIVHKFQTSKQICIALILLFFLMVGVAGGVGVFVSFVYKYTLLIQEYRNSRGVIAFLGPIVPSVFATSVGGIFTTIIPCIKNPPPKDVPSPKDKDDQKKDDPKDDRNKDDQKKDDSKDDGADKDDQKEDDSKEMVQQ